MVTFLKYCLPLLFFLSPILQAQPDCDFTVIRAPDQQTESSTSVTTSTFCSLSAGDEQQNIAVIRNENIGGVIQVFASAINASTREQTRDNPNVCVVNVVSDFPILDGLREEVPLVNGVCEAELEVDVFVAQNVTGFVFTATAVVSNPDSELLNEASGTLDPTRVFNLELTVLESCSDLSDENPACVNARNALADATGRDGSIIILRNIERLENVVLGSCVIRADTSTVCLAAKDALFAVTGRRGNRLIVARLEQLVIDECRSRRDNRRSCLTARQALFEDTGRRGFGLTRNRN